MQASRKFKEFQYKKFRYFVNYSCAQEKHPEKRKLKITLEVLNEVSVQFLETKQFIEGDLEQKCFKRNISMKEVINLFTSLVAKSQHRK